MITRLHLSYSPNIHFPLQSCYPVRLRRIIVLTAPFWFRASFQLLRVFIKEELRDRVHVLRPSPGSRLASLSNPDPVAAKEAHYSWLLTALSDTVAIPNEVSLFPPFVGSCRRTCDCLSWISFCLFSKSL